MFFFSFLFYVLIRSKSRFGANPMASFLSLEQIWVWVKKHLILFFATSFISFEPKLKMAAVAASISSTSLFAPYTFARPKTHNPQPHKPSNSNSKKKQPLRNPSDPPPRTDDRSKLLHPTLCWRFDVHPHSDATLTQLHPTLQSHTHLQHLRSVISKANLWVWGLICGGGAWLIWVWVLRNVTCRLRFGFWW